MFDPPKALTIPQSNITLLDKQTKSMKESSKDWSVCKLGIHIALIPRAEYRACFGSLLLGMKNTQKHLQAVLVSEEIARRLCGREDVQFLS